MKMNEWAKREIELACKKENPTDSDYICNCYQSAYDAYLSLIADGHSGMSINLTKNILNRLIDGKPLTPIEDTPDIWIQLNEEGDSFQCTRMSSLFKDISEDGTVSYHDIERFVCLDENRDYPYHSNFVKRIASEYIPPITMPYFPGKPYRVITEVFLTDPVNGDFDTIGIYTIEVPDNYKNIINIDRYFKIDQDDINWVEINFEEYCYRRGAANRRADREEEQNAVSEPRDY